MRKGWTRLEIPELADADGGDYQGKNGVKGGGKAKGMVRKGSVLNETPLGAGIKDGGVLAFKLREGGVGREEGGEMELDDGEWVVEMPGFEEGEEGGVKI